MCRMKTSILKTILLAWVLIAPCLGAQPAAAPPKVGEIKVSLESLGSDRPDITEAYVRNHIRIRPGDEFRAGMTNPDVHALMKTGRFHDVRVDASQEDGKLAIEFTVVVYPKVTSVDLLLRRPDGTTLTAASLQIKEKELLKKVALRRGVRYMIWTAEYVLRFWYQAPPKTVDVFADSDWAGDTKTRKSCSAGALMHGAHQLESWSVSQQVISLSSGE